MRRDEKVTLSAEDVDRTLNAGRLWTSFSLAVYFRGRWSGPMETRCTRIRSTDRSHASSIMGRERWEVALLKVTLHPSNDAEALKLTSASLTRKGLALICREISWAFHHPCCGDHIGLASWQVSNLRMDSSSIGTRGWHAVGLLNLDFPGNVVAEPTSMLT